MKTHVLENFLIIQYRPMIFKNNCGTGRYEKTKTQYHIYIHTDAYKGKCAKIDNRDYPGRKEGWDDTNMSAATLAEAFATAVAYLYDGCNSRAARYFLLSVGPIK